MLLNNNTKITSQTEKDKQNLKTVICNLKSLQSSGNIIKISMWSMEIKNINCSPFKQNV